MEYHVSFPRALLSSLLVEDFQKLLVVEADITVVIAVGVGGRMLMGVWVAGGELSTCAILGLAVICSRSLWSSLCCLG